MTTLAPVPGAWAWEDTAQALRERGHTALPLTLTGLGDYADSGTPETDLETHSADLTDSLLDAGVSTLAFLNQPPWRRFDLSTGHWPTLSAPAELAGVLDAAVS